MKMNNEIAKLLSGQWRRNTNLYIWLTSGTTVVNLYKYCSLMRYVVKTGINQQELEYYLDDNYISCYNKLFITKGMIEFYKGKTYNMIQDDYDIEQKYAMHNGVKIGYKFEYDDKTITKDGIKYILYTQISLFKGVKINAKLIRFINTTKKFGFKKDKILRKTGITSELYDMIDDDYYKYLYDIKSFDRYLAYKQFTTDSIACMEFIKALENSAADTNSDAVVSVNAINSIIVGANINKHLDEK